MNYKTWQETIVASLMREGMEKEEAFSRARSVRGCYYDENNHPSPYRIASDILQSDRITPLEKRMNEINKKKILRKERGYRTKVIA